MSPCRRSPIAIAIALLAASLTDAAPAAAQALLEEITVTAQKRQEDAQDVGISLTAFGSKQLAELGVQKTVDITQQVPGMQLFTFTPAFTVFNLRGISQNNFQDNLEAPVAVYMDGVYVASMNAINGQMFDTDRVEVLRGPQGTLFGRNATGGLVHYLNRKATEEESNGYVQAGAGNFGAWNIEGASGGALGKNLRGRIAARVEKADGYVKAGTAFGTQATGPDSHGADGYALRGNLQFDLSEATRIDLTAAYSKDDDVPSGQYVVTLAGFDANTGLGVFNNAYNLDPVDPDNNPPVGPTNYPRTPITGNAHRHWSNADTGFNRDSTSVTLHVDHDFSDAVQFVSITNWTQLDKDYLEDAGGGFGYFPYHTINDFEQFSQELRFSGSGDAWRWQAGTYFLDMTADTEQSVAGALILGGTSDTQMMETYGKVDSRNASLFGQGEYDITDQLTVIAGLRWSQDKKDIDFTRYYSDVPAGIPRAQVFDISTLLPKHIDSIDYADYAARLQLNWTPGEDTLVYLSWNRGIKGGNWSMDPLGAVANTKLKHKEETLYAYELGFKSEFLDGLARLNGSVFYYDYKDYQAFSLSGLTPQVTNSDAEEHGGELEFTVAPVEGLELMLGASWLDSKVDAVPDVFGGTVRAEFPNAPRTSLNWLLRYEWPALNGSIAAAVDGKWNDDQYLEGTNSEVSFEGSYAVWNASLSWRGADERLKLVGWVKNLGDEEYRLYNLDIGVLGFIEQVFAPPRTYGVTVSYAW